MRGQAFIIFRDINSAMEAKRRNHGKELHGKTMVSFPSTRKYNLPEKNQM
jgi:RNA recognition motif-containing protein